MIEYYEPHFSLHLPKVAIDCNQLPWVPYNPRKNIPRWGSSLTSLDGKTTGIPDLDSLRDYNTEHNTSYTEKDFATKTPNYQYFNFLDQYFDLGRSHVIRLGSGGFFPYHRDYDGSTFRLLYTINGCEDQNLVWILNGELVKLENHKWYYINTKMIHSVFSFYGSEFAVFNVINNEKARHSLVNLLTIK